MKYCQTSNSSDESEIGQMIFIAEAWIGIYLKCVVVPLGRKREKTPDRMFKAEAQESEFAFAIVGELLQHSRTWSGRDFRLATSFLWPATAVSRSWCTRPT